jgi:small subunit ribosomal protein S20
MANHKSSLKRARQDKVRNARNRARTATMRSAVRQAEEAATTKDKTTPQKLSRAQSTIARAAKKGILHWKTAARKQSRLNARVKKASGK